MIRVLNLSGDAHSIGRQHGEQVSDLRPQIQTSIKIRLADVAKGRPRLLSPVKRNYPDLGKIRTETLEMLRGMAEALDLDWDEYFTYTIASYLTSCLNNTSQERRLFHLGSQWKSHP